MLQWSYRSEIRQAPRQQRCRGTCQISERLEKFKPEFRGFTTSRDLAVRRLTAKWIEAQQSNYSPKMYQFVHNTLLLDREVCGRFRWDPLISMAYTDDKREKLFMRFHFPVIYRDINSIHGWQWVDNAVLWMTELSIGVNRNHRTLLWPFLLTWINLIPTWINNYTPSNVRDKITYPFINFNGCTAEV